MNPEFPFSVITPYGEQNSSDGYSNSPTGSISYGARARALTCDTYQRLIDRGWRRSGTYIYAPKNQVTMSPQYTIRANVHTFELSKDQRALLRKVRRFLDGHLPSGTAEAARHPTAAHAQAEARRGRAQRVSSLLAQASFAVLSPLRQRWPHAPCWTNDALSVRGRACCPAPGARPHHAAPSARPRHRRGTLMSSTCLSP